MKRSIYITATIILGILLSFLAHGVVEHLMIKLLVKKGPWLNWDTWFLIHHIGTFVLLAAGVFLGYWFGKKWWHIVYVEKRHWRWHNHTKTI